MAIDVHSALVNKGSSSHIKVARVCHTEYDVCMTMLSFRAGSDDVENLERWVNALGLERSHILREALHKHLVRLASEDELESWNKMPLEDDELELQKISEWGVAPDWADWHDATR